LLFSELIFLLNPEVPHTWRNVLSIWGVLAITYGLAAGFAFFFLLSVVEMLRGRTLGPAWLSFRVLTWLAMLTLATSAALMWHNLVTLRLYLPPPTPITLAIAATVVTTAAGAFLVMGLFHYSFGRRGARASYVISALSLAAAVALPLLMRPQPATSGLTPRMPIEDTPSDRRLTLIGIEGASMSYVLPAIAEGKLPNFARLIETGAAGALRTIYPTESIAVWTSLATGKLPRKHGLKAFYRYRFPGVETTFTLRPRGLDFRPLERLGLVGRGAVTATSRRTQTFWGVLSSFGVDVGIVRWWGTYPAEDVRGFIVSEYLHRQVREGITPPLPGLTYPEELYASLVSRVRQPEDINGETLRQFVDTSIVVPSDNFPWRAELARSLADDATYQEIGDQLRDDFDPDVYAIYFFGLDTIGHYFTRYHRPDHFGDVSDDEIRKYGRTIEAYYHHLDAVLGEFMERRAENETIIVLSGHGMEPLPLARRIVEPFKGNPHLSGYHEASPDGLLILNGPGIAEGVKFQGASILDVAPTLLYLMGLPLGLDMDGALLTEVLEEELIRSQPVTFISSYHNFLIEARRAEDVVDTWSPLDAIPRLLENPD
jgi:predicted AlkP superfamily phosphohydrolase/phosphomutase